MYIQVVTYNQGEGNTKGDRDMVKVTGLDKLAKEIEAAETMRKIHKEAKARRLKELMAQGIDREIAKAMIEAGL